MYKQEQGELWVHPGSPGVIIVTTRGSVTDDKLEMLDFYDKAAVAKIPDAGERCGKVIGSNKRYGFQMVIQPQGARLGFGIFQISDGWRYEDTMDLLVNSTDMLTKFAVSHTDWNFRMNFPQLGLSRLSATAVGNAMLEMPDNITLTYRASTRIKTIFAEIETYLIMGERELAIKYLTDIDFEKPTEQVDSILEIMNSQGRHWEE